MAKIVMKKLNQEKKGLLTTIGEMIGRVKPMDTWFIKNRNWVMDVKNPSVDYSKCDYTLTKAIFYASIRQNREGQSRGEDYLLGATFGKPIVNATAAFTIGKMPVFLIDDPNRQDGKEMSDAHYHAQEEVNGFFKKNRATIFKTVRNCFRDGDYYVELSDDLKLKMIPPEAVEILDDPVTGEIKGFDVTRYVKENVDGKSVTYKYVTKHRKTSPYREVTRYEPNKKEDAGVVLPEYTIDQDKLTELYGDAIGEDNLNDWPLPIVAFQNEREGDERYGNTEYQSCFTVMAKYHAVLDEAIGNNIYNSSARPVIKGIENMETFLQANGTPNSDGEYEVTWDKDELLLLGKGGDAFFMKGAENEGGSVSLLEILFWLICQTSETPEFVMGTAVQSSKASVSEQMPVMLQKAERKQTEMTSPLEQLAKLFLFKASFTDNKLPDNYELSLKWLPILDKDLKVNVEIVELLQRLGLITGKTADIMLGIEDYVSDIDQEIEDAQAEKKERDEQQMEYDFGRTVQALKEKAGGNKGDQDPTAADDPSSEDNK